MLTPIVCIDGSRPQYLCVAVASAGILRATRLTCSAGIAPNPMLAKIASDLDKPNGQHRVSPDSAAYSIQFMRTLPVRKVPFIGRVQQRVLKEVRPSQRSACQ